MEYYAPNLCCSAADVEQLHDCLGRYTVGRGQQHIGFCDGNEDTVSMAMTVFERLVSSCQLPLAQIGRLEIGTESQVDRAKSVKSFLMAFFQMDGLHNVEGTDTYNACYGGTNALFSTVNWVQSVAWSGQYGIVVCSDPAVHPQPKTLAGIGASAVGLMVGADQGLVIEPVRMTFIKHAWCTPIIAYAVCLYCMYSFALRIELLSTHCAVSAGTSTVQLAGTTMTR